jgi:hypothetical protein
MKSPRVRSSDIPTPCVATLCEQCELSLLSPERVAVLYVQELVQFFGDEIITRIGCT